MKAHAPPKKPVRRGKKPRKTSSPRVRKPRKRLTLRQRIRRALVPCFLVCALLVARVFYVIDHRVVVRLHSLTAPRLPVIYSSPLDITGLITRVGGDATKDLKAVRGALVDRRYSEVVGTPTRPGEFSVGPNALSIYSRAFTNFNGESIPARKEVIPFKPDVTDVPGHLYVEPQVISYIGSADVRASSFVPLTQMPAIVQHSVISIEDERFYSHFGLDILSIARAIVRNLLARRLVQGGSTLTQQLAKNLFLSPRRTLSRKLLEIPTALSLERHLSKSELLELYLNEVYLGQKGSVAIHGMPEAASAFFGKKLEDLRVDEAATLAGMIKAPSSYNPRRYPERARERRDLVLQKLMELGHISAAEFAVAIKRPVRTVSQQEHRRLAPFYSTALESELSQSIDLDVAHATGLSVYTGLDLGMQECAERTLIAGLTALESSHPKLKQHEGALQGSLIAIEPHSGLVKAWVGGRDFSASQFNRVNQSARQIGSTVKPFLYLSALDGSLNSYKVATAASILEDKPMELQVNKKSWNPENYDHEFRGDVTLRFALENSLNMPALYIAERIGISTLKRTLSLFRLAPQVNEVPALALGALDTNLLRLTAAYAALANGGIYVSPRLFITALDGDNERLASVPVAEERVAEENATFVLTNILQGVVERGTARGIRAKGIQRPVAGKTGTSDDTRDAWFVGFTPNIAIGVWVGFDDNSPLGLTGGAGAVPIWADFMNCAGPFLADSQFIAPPGVSFQSIDVLSGGLATESCPSEKVTSEVFIKGTEPHRPCPIHADGAEVGDADAPEELFKPTQRENRSGFWQRILGN